MQYNRYKDFTEGTLIIADDIDAEFNSVKNVVNGNIGSDNLTNGAVTKEKMTSSLATFLCPTGSIMAFAGESTPSGWLKCDGSSVLRSDYVDLFGVIGTLWGSADSTHFNVPDTEGMFLRGWTDDNANAATRDPDRASRLAFTGGSSGNRVGSWQDHQVESHTHTEWGPLVNALTPATGDYYPDAGEGRQQNNTGATGGNETRPVNVYVNYIIKA